VHCAFGRVVVGTVSILGFDGGVLIEFGPFRVAFNFMGISWWYNFVVPRIL